MTFYPRAKQELIDSGMNADRVEAMPVGQVLAIQTSRSYRYIYDQQFKWFYVPLWQGRKQAMATEQRLIEEGYLGGGWQSRETIPIANVLMPGVRAAMFAQGRLDRDTAALRALEALRGYAASHKGHWPATLAEVSEMPIPRDPVTGQAFPFQMQNGRAELLLTAEPDVPRLQGRRYVLELVPPK